MYVCVSSLFICVCIYASAFHQDLLRSALPTKRLCIYSIEPLSLQSPHGSSVSVSACKRHTIYLSTYHCFPIFQSVSQSVNHRHTTGGCLLCPHNSFAIAKEAREETGETTSGDPGDPFPLPLSPCPLLDPPSHHCPETLPFPPTYHHTLLTPI